jgi:hypothetical protein
MQQKNDLFMSSLILESKVFKTWLEDGICKTFVKPNSEIVLEDAKENTEMVKKICSNIPYPLLVDLRNIKSISKEARDHFSMRNRKPMVSAIGMLINSQLSKIIGNFFLGLNKPVVPTQLFNSEEKVLEWLHQFEIPTVNSL